MFDWTKDVEGQDRPGIVNTLAYLGCGLAFALFILGALGKRVVFRLIPSADMRSIPSEVMQIGTVVMQGVSVAIATLIVMN